MNDKQPKLKVIPSFATPIVDSRHPEADELNPQLAELFLNCERDPEYRKKIKTPTLQINIFESEFDLFGWQEPCVRKLRDFCIDALYITIARLNGFSVEHLNKLEIFHHSWFHVTRYGGYIAGHNHPMASWSGVYCVAPGEQPEDQPDSGVLRFHDPTPAANMFMDPANAHLKRPYGGGSINFKLEPGQLLLFPSWLMHEVAPFFGRDTRITVAFNAWAREIPQGQGGGSAAS
jgi:hypothetical protein